jgi:hypothetical protein
MTTSQEDKKKYVNKSSKDILTRMIKDDNSRDIAVKKLLIWRNALLSRKIGFGIR